MPQFSTRSLETLGTCEQKLVNLMKKCIEEVDFTVLCGHRSESEQDKAFAEGKSKLKYPASKHNAYPARAVDIAPCKYGDDKKLGAGID